MRQILDEAEGAVRHESTAAIAAATPSVDEESIVRETSLVAETTPDSVEKQSMVRETSLVTETRLVNDQMKEWSMTSLVPETSLVTETSLITETSLPDIDLFAGLPDVDGYLQIPNRIADHLLPLLAPHSQLVYIRLFRLSWGFNKPFCTVSLPKLAEKTQLSQSSVQRAIADLEKKGLLRKSDRVFGRSRAQGITYEVVTGTSLVPETSLVRKTSLVRETNNKYLKENIKSDIQENPVYEVRKIAARLREINLGSPDYSVEKLRADVRTAVDGQGMNVDEATLNEALKGITV